MNKKDTLITAKTEDTESSTSSNIANKIYKSLLGLAALVPLKVLIDVVINQSHKQDYSSYFNIPIKYFETNSDGIIFSFVLFLIILLMIGAPFLLRYFYKDVTKEAFSGYLFLIFSSVFVLFCLILSYTSIYYPFFRFILRQISFIK